MNETTNLNSELLSADARGRKHIPFAVFAVILIHVILFLVLLIAAGCRAKARARRNAQPAQELAAERRTVPGPVAPAQPAVPGQTPATASANSQAIMTPVSTLPAPPAASGESVVATEPPAEKHATSSGVRKAAQKTSPAPGSRPTAGAPHKPKMATIYVVKAGDTVEKIAKMHRTSVQAIKAENNLKDYLLRPGQQLRVSSQKAKNSNEA